MMLAELVRGIFEICFAIGAGIVLCAIMSFGRRIWE